jgi:hypothetical protein
MKLCSAKQTRRGAHTAPANPGPGTRARLHWGCAPGCGAACAAATTPQCCWQRCMRVLECGTVRGTEVQYCWWYWTRTEVQHCLPTEVQILLIEFIPYALSTHAPSNSARTTPSARRAPTRAPRACNKPPTPKHTSGGQNWGNESLTAPPYSIDTAAAAPVTVRLMHFLGTHTLPPAAPAMAGSQDSSSRADLQETPPPLTAAVSHNMGSRRLEIPYKKRGGQRSLLSAPEVHRVPSIHLSALHGMAQRRQQQIFGPRALPRAPHHIPRCTHKKFRPMQKSCNAAAVLSSDARCCKPDAGRPGRARVPPQCAWGRRDLPAWARQAARARRA